LLPARLSSKLDGLTSLTVPLLLEPHQRPLGPSGTTPSDYGTSYTKSETPHESKAGSSSTSGTSSSLCNGNNDISGSDAGVNTCSLYISKGTSGAAGATGAAPSATRVLENPHTGATGAVPPHTGAVNTSHPVVPPAEKTPEKQGVADVLPAKAVVTENQNTVLENNTVLEPEAPDGVFQLGDRLMHKGLKKTGIVVEMGGDGVKLRYDDSGKQFWINERELQLVARKPTRADSTADEWPTVGTKVRRHNNRSVGIVKGKVGPAQVTVFWPAIGRSTLEQIGLLREAVQ